MRLGICDRCRMRKMVNAMTWKCNFIGNYCGDCFESGTVNHDEPGRCKEPPDDPSWMNNSNPWQENAIRELEEG